MVIPVNLGAHSYTIVVEPGILGAAGARLRQLGVGSRTAVVSDATVMRLHGGAVVKGLEAAGFAVTIVQVPEGETAKTLRVAERCWVDRTSTVLALGGGAVGDLAGFVAASYMRGINFVQLPTTVLAQVDASIGGKTAIDHPKVKNLIGAFHQPRLVLVDPAVVQSLPDREFRSGLAEIVKHGIVLDADYLADVERSAPALLARDLDTLARIIGGSCRLKAGIIERDPEERSELRYALNSGHTIGHALEAVTGFSRWTHGEAVALGLVAEAHLAEGLGLAAPATTRRQEAVLAALGLPVRAGDVDATSVLEAITRDKKARDGRVPFVLAPAIGAFRVVYDVPADDVRRAVAVLGHPETR
jgi:3-dehydroquinate synthase